MSIMKMYVEEYLAAEQVAENRYIIHLSNGKEGAINNGERFPYKYDRRHIINLTLNHKFSERIDIGASWVFYTGGTSTIPEEKTTIIRPGNGANNGFILGFDNNV